MSQSKRNDNEKKPLKPILIIAAAAAALIALFVCLNHVEEASSVVKTEDYAITEEESEATEGIVTIGGVKCKKRNNIETYLFVGIDADGKVDDMEVDADSYNRCDVIRVLVIDKTNDTYIMLPINRDTVTQIRTYAEDGEDLGLGECQIAMAPTTGTEEQRVENVVEAVSLLLGGQRIDGYAMFNIDSIGLLNDLVGGVTVTIEDDFSEADPTLVMGETITLNKSQAETYVRGRMSVGDGENTSRMRRQETYISGLKEKMIEKSKADEGFAWKIYNTLTDYMQTDMTGNDFSKIAKALIMNEDLGTLEIKGDFQVDELEWVEFIPDEDSLNEIIRTLYYQEVEEQTGQVS